jgi:hypothetical protein
LEVWISLPNNCQEAANITARLKLVTGMKTLKQERNGKYFVYAKVAKFYLFIAWKHILKIKKKIN